METDRTLPCWDRIRFDYSRLCLVCTHQQKRTTSFSLFCLGGHTLFFGVEFLACFLGRLGADVLRWRLRRANLYNKTREAQRHSCATVRVRFHIIRNACIENVGKSQSCMVSKLRIVWKQTVVPWAAAVGLLPLLILILILRRRRCQSRNPGLQSRQDVPLLLLLLDLIRPHYGCVSR